MWLQPAVETLDQALVAAVPDPVLLVLFLEAAVLAQRVVPAGKVVAVVLVVIVVPAVRPWHPDPAYPPLELPELVVVVVVVEVVEIVAGPVVAVVVVLDYLEKVIVVPEAHQHAEQAAAVAGVFVDKTIHQALGEMAECLAVVVAVVADLRHQVVAAVLVF